MTSTDAEIFRLLDPVGRRLVADFASLTPAQRVAIPQVLERRPVLLVSRTASGKTEAVLAPLLTLMSRERWPGCPSILYIAPTRALVNDMWQRIDLKTRGMVTVARRTGEHREGSEDATLLLTTPESLDSMLVRGWRGERHILAGVRAVVLDELHLLAESARGTQLQVLLTRLNGRTLPNSVLRIGLSATVPRPQDLATAFLGSDAVVCSSPGSRAVELDGLAVGPLPPLQSGVDPLARSVVRFAPETHDVQLAERLVAIRRETPSEAFKALVFVPSRTRCDELSSVLSRILHERARIPVFAHHASLDRAERERTESLFREQGRDAVAVATSTLEVGIDIGDISMVVLDGPPPSVSSLLQRIGRGNRRTDKVRVLATAHDRVQAATLASMIRAAVGGELDSTGAVAHFSVAFQQMASLLRQARHPVSKQGAVDRLSGAFGERAEWLVTQLVGAGVVECDPVGMMRAGERMRELMDQPMKLHANIGGGLGGVPLIDAVTGETLAWVADQPQDPSVLIGGVAYCVTRVGDSIELGRGVRGGSGAKVRYGARAAPIGRAALSHLARGLGLPVNALVRHDGEYLHFGGALFGQVLTLAGNESGPMSSLLDPRRALQRGIPSVVASGWQKLEKLCCFGPFQRELPESIRRAAVVATVDGSGFLDWLGALEEVPGLTTEQAEIVADA